MFQIKDFANAKFRIKHKKCRKWGKSNTPRKRLQLGVRKRAGTNDGGECRGRV